MHHILYRSIWALFLNQTKDSSPPKTQHKPCDFLISSYYYHVNIQHNVSSSQSIPPIGFPVLYHGLAWHRVAIDFPWVPHITLLSISPTHYIAPKSIVVLTSWPGPDRDRSSHLLYHRMLLKQIWSMPGHRFNFLHYCMFLKQLAISGHIVILAPCPSLHTPKVAISGIGDSCD